MTTGTTCRRLAVAHRRPIGAACAVLITIFLTTAPPAAAQQSLSFVSINQSDDQTEKADEMLRDALAEALGNGLGTARGLLDRESYGYGQAITELSEWRTGRKNAEYLGRVTPYVFIAAEMLGADFEVLGTYLSRATKSTTYHSYFVVNRDRFDAVVDLKARKPDLNDILTFIRKRVNSSPVKFIYHSKFSTSSYFLPALFFGQNDVFATSESGGLADLQSEEISGNSSTSLVRQVAAGGADLAAVWDGTKVKFGDAGDEEDRQLAAKVYFVQLPTALPNDLLVCSRSLNPDAKLRIREALRRRTEGKVGLEIDVADFERWVDIDTRDAGDALEALATLRWRAHQRPAPVTVKIDRARDDDRISEPLLEAARQAVRLSGTEFTIYDASFHKKVDYVWTLHWVREGHVILESRIPDFDVKQQFRISFQPANGATGGVEEDHEGVEENDLTQRIGNLLASRLDRIRYVWPYDRQHPLVIRDVPFSLAADTEAKVQRIIWNDPLRNDYTFDDIREVRIRSSDFFKFRLEDFAATSLEPMSKVAYRVLLVRPDEPETMFAVFNGVFYALVTLSLGGTFVAFRRSGPTDAEPPERPSLTVVGGAEDDRGARR